MELRLSFEIASEPSPALRIASQIVPLVSIEYTISVTDTLEAFFI